jgi:hypothetical protein
MMGFDYWLHPVQAELSWPDQQITVEKGAEEGSQQTER